MATIDEIRNKSRERFEELLDRYYSGNLPYQPPDNREYKELYSLYMKQPEWLELRKRVGNRCNWICEKCKKNPFYDTHHKTYENCFKENLEDLEGLCRTCHKNRHKDKIKSANESEDIKMQIKSTQNNYVREMSANEYVDQIVNNITQENIDKLKNIETMVRYMETVDETIGILKILDDVIYRYPNKNPKMFGPIDRKMEEIITLTFKRLEINKVLGERTWHSFRFSKGYKGFSKNKTNEEVKKAAKVSASSASKKDTYTHAENYFTEDFSTEEREFIIKRRKLAECKLKQKEYELMIKEINKDILSDLGISI